MYCVIAGVDPAPAYAYAQPPRGDCRGTISWLVSLGVARVGHMGTLGLNQTPSCCALRWAALGRVWWGGWIADMRKAGPRDVEKKSIVPLDRPGRGCEVTPDELLSTL